MVNKMYKDKKTDKPIPTWNPFKGCDFNCVYCEPSFKRQAKRQKHRCYECYTYKPHFHPERLNKIPKGDLIFACANGDISFASNEIIEKIFDAIKTKPNQDFLLQTKNPKCLINKEIPDNVIVGTTIETNYGTFTISSAPSPEVRIFDLWLIEHERKFVTHEPILKFDLDTLVKWDRKSNLEMVWVGYANHTKGMKNLVEPELSKVKELIKELESFTDVRLKTIREKQGYD